MLEYSVIIRTTGKAKEKYKKLLQSISNLQPKPKDIIVVLPEGCELPKNQLGNEHFFSVLREWSFNVYMVYNNAELRMHCLPMMI